MCGGPERLRSSSSPTLQEEKSKKNKNARSSSVAEGMDQLADETDGSLSSLLELAANNDVVALKRSLDRDSSGVDEVDLWYGREEGSNRMDLKRRTPLMVAATYGSLDVLGLLLSLSSSIEVNRVSDGVTALHLAASGGSTKATDAVKLLLSAGADPNSVNATGCRPVDVIVVPPKLPYVRTELEELLGKSNGATADYSNHAHRVITSPSCTEFPSLASSSCADASLSSCSPSPPMSSAKISELQPNALPEKKEYPVGQSLPDIKNSIYASDEFRMYSFKVRPCSRAYSHDWTECPFVHPGENARRRDPRKYPYSCVPCPDFRKGACRRGVSCEYAHGVFECWLHPAQYRTRLCKDGTSCARRVCFFAHTNEELRPLYMSTGSSVSSLMDATAALEMGSTMGLMPGSPMSPSTNGIGHSSLAWPQPNVPVMHLPGSNLPASRLRSSLSARNMPLDDFSGMLGCGDAQQLVNDLCYTRLGSSLPGQFLQPKILVPSNFDDLFSAAIAPSPVYDSDQGAIFSPSRKAAILNKIQRQQQNLLSPISTAFSPKNMDCQQLHEHSALLQDTLGVSSPGMVSPRSMDAISSMSSHPDLLAQQGNKQLTHQSFSSRHHGSGTSQIVVSPDSSSWSKWASPSRKLDWGVNGEELGQLRGSSSFEMRANSEEPDLSWVHSLERESPHEKVFNASMMAFDPSSLRPTIGVEASISDDQFIGLNQSTGLRAWLEKFQLDQMLTEQGQLHEDRHFIVTNDLSK